jgi:hypothetical protein
MPSWLNRKGRDHTTSALDVTMDPPIDGYERAQDLLEALADLSGSTAQVITPESLGGDPTGASDAFDAVKEAIETAAAGNFRCELRGTYLLNPTSTIAVSKTTLVQGGGTLHLASAPVGNLLWDINIPPLFTLSILGIVPSTFDVAGVNSSDSAVSRIQLSPADCSNVHAGDEVKVISQDLPAGGVASSYQGEHAYVLAVASPYVYLTAPLRYSYVTIPRLLVLDSAQDVFMRDLKFTADYDKLVAENWAFDYLRVAGVIEPVFGNMKFRDGADTGLRLAGTARAVSEGLAFKRFRNAVTTQLISGYGIRETGTLGSIHIGLRGTDVRHAWTCSTSAGAPLDPVVNGRTIAATVIGGVAQGSSACGFDTHPDADGVVFFGCKSFAPYDGESSSYSGFQLRGKATCIACEAYGGAVGFSLKRESAGEDGMRRLQGCTYIGDHVPVLVSNAVGLAGASAEVNWECNDLYAETPEIYAVAIYSPGKGRINRGKVVHTCSVAFHSTVRFETGSDGAQLDIAGLEADITGATGGNYRMVNYKPAGCVVDIDARVINGSVAWDGWIGPSTGVVTTITGYAQIEADTMPAVADGGPGAIGGSTWAARISAKRGRIGNNGRRIRVAVGNASVNLPLGNCLHERIQTMVTANSANSKLVSFDAGRVEGQLLFIHCDPTSPQSLTIVPLEAGLIRASANIVLAAKAGCTFMWTFDKDGDNAKDTGMWCQV